MKPDQPLAPARWFVLQAEDETLGCPVFEARFAVSNFPELLTLLGDDAKRDPSIPVSYFLDDDQVATISARFDIPFEAGGRNVFLESWHANRNAPYLIHTGYELALMLEGRKPFAKFSGGYPCDEHPDDVLGFFAPYVEADRIVQRIVDRPFPETRVGANGLLYEGDREIYFALPGQEWRINANMLLFETGTKFGWNDTFERLEGALLGYEDWQNDWHLANRFCRRAHE